MSRADPTLLLPKLLAAAAVVAQLVLPSGRPARGQTPGKPEEGALRLSISVSPDKLVLGEPGEATVQVRVQGVPDARLQDTRIRLHVKVGRFTSIRRTGPGELTATYKPPGTFFPQFAIIAAVARNDRITAHGWTVLPLWGVGEAVVKSRPRALVKVHIGESTYGPVRANRYGRAVIPIVAPPGIKKAKAGEREIDLKLPAVNRIVTIARDERLSADGSQKTIVWIHAVNDEGKPARGAPLRLGASRGRVSAARPVGDGIYLAEYTPPRRLGNGRATVSVGVEGDPASKDSVMFLLFAGKPARLGIRAVPASFTAGGKEKIRIEVEVSDAAGNPATAEPELAANLGEVGKPQPAGPGRYRASLAVPDFFQGRKEIRIRATLPSGSHQKLRAECPVALEAAYPSRMRFIGHPEQVVADGKTPSPLEFLVYDRYGNPVPGLKPEASASEGSVVSVTEGSDLTYSVRYVPPLRRLPARDSVRASVGKLVAETEIGLLEQPHAMSVSPIVGYLTNFGHLNSAYFSAELSIRLPLPGRWFFLLVDCGYYFSNRDRSREGISSSLSVVPLTGSFAYRFKLSDRLHLLLSAGAGAYFAASRIVLEGQPQVEHRATVLGFHGHVGAAYRIGPGDATLQAGYIHAEASGIEGLSGNIGGLAILAGYRLGLF